MNKINIYQNKYHSYFYISKFLLVKQQNIFNITFIKYSSDVNKLSLVYIFWIFYLLFGQIPKLQNYNKNKFLEKIGHSFLIITKSQSNLYLNLKKITNFFLLFSNLELSIIGKKNKSKINNIILKENTYFPELIKLPRFFVDSFDIIMSIKYNNRLISTLEKSQIFRILQIPVSVQWVTKKIKKKIIYD